MKVIPVIPPELRPLFLLMEEGLQLQTLTTFIEGLLIETTGLEGY